jgi:type I restriction enzyme, S subunit
VIDDLNPFPSMKDSGVPWLGEVPMAWDVVRCRHLFEIRKRIAGVLGFPVLSVTQQGLRPRDIRSGEGQLSQDYSKYQLVKPGEFAMNAMDLLTGGVGLANCVGVTSPDYRVFGLRDATNKRTFFLYLLRLLYTNHAFYAHGQGSAQLGRWRLPRKRFNEFLFPVPPIEEQAAIVRFLDHADRKIRSYIRAKQKLINLLEEQKQAIIHRAVTCGLDPNVRLKPSGVEWLGDVPEHWRIVALKHVLKRLVDCEHKTAPAVEQSGYRVIRTTAVRYGHLLWSGTYCTTAEAFKAWSQRAVPEPDDVIFTREAPAGEACLVPDGAQVCLGQRTVLMKLRRDEYDSRFLVHMIYAGPPRLRIQLASQGSTVGHFNMDDIGSMKVLVPPLAEQQSIVSIINQDTNGLTKAVERAEHEINLLREYRTRLIADVVTGKLDVREAAAQLHDEDQELPPIDESDEISESEEDEPDDLDVAPLEDPET